MALSIRTTALAATAILALLSTARAQAADLTGRWATESSGGIVEIAPCGEAICGALVGSPYLSFDPTLRDRRNRDAALRSRPLKGLTILRGFTGGPSAWTAGEIYNPDDGRTYAASLEMVSADQLRVRACAGQRRCRTQLWYRLAD